MNDCFLRETELPGRRIDEDTRRIVAHRYAWAARHLHDCSVLEVGCGPGLGVGLMAARARRVTAGDLGFESLRIGAQHYGGRADFVQFNAERLPFAESSFDAVLSVASIIYMDVPAFLSESSRVLTANGRLLLNTPNCEAAGFRPSALSRGYYSAAELEKLLQGHGFSPRFSGGFPAVSPDRARKNIVGPAMRVGAALMRRSGLGMLVDAVNRRRKPITLTGELDLADTEGTGDIELVPFSSDRVPPGFRIIYVEAVKG